MQTPKFRIPLKFRPYKVPPGAAALPLPFPPPLGIPDVDPDPGIF